MAPDEPRDDHLRPEDESGEPFPGIPPEELPSKEEPLPDDDIPELEPEFMEALRQAGGGSAPPPAASEQGGETVEFNPFPDDQETGVGGGPAHGETVEYQAGEAPEEHPPAPSPPPAPDPVPAPAPTPSPDPAPSPEPEPTLPVAAEENAPEPEPEPEAESEPEPGPEPADREEASEPEPFVPAQILEPERESVPPPSQVSATDQTRVLPGAREEVRAAVAAAEEEGKHYAPPRPPAGGYGEPAPKRKRLWWRFLLGSTLIVLAFASATTAASVLKVMDWLDGFQGLGEKVERELVPPEPGEPQTFLLLGSDRRLAEGDAPGLSDTTILLRLDADKDRIAILNIPRDLKVYIPGHYTAKFNEAYALGGPQLTVRTIKSITRGTGLTINHVVNINFLGFAQAINAINCVYVDVDRDYFHSNVGVPAELQYDEIDIDPGYQKLCGADALDYARYRHTDTDLVRAARQQDFLREARSRVPYEALFRQRDQLFKIFGSHTESDIDEFDEALSVIKLMISSISSPIEEVRFPATLGPSYVYASRSDIRGAIAQFLDISPTSGPRGTLDDPQGGSDTAAGGALEPDAPGSQPLPELENGPNQPEPEPEPPAEPAPEDDGLVDTEFGLEVAKQLTPKLAAGFPVFYPRRVPEGSVFDEPRAYHINDDNLDTHGAYRMVLQVQLPDGIHYFGVQGIKGWETPPIISNPSETLEMNGREYEIFVEGDRVRLVAWREDGNSYWVANSLLNTLTNDQMLGIARSMGSIEPNPKPRRGRNGRRGNR